jgi:hypothetical protein
MKKAMKSHAGIPHNRTLRKPEWYAAKNKTTDAKSQNMTVSYFMCAQYNAFRGDCYATYVAKPWIGMPWIAQLSRAGQSNAQHCKATENKASNLHNNSFGIYVKTRRSHA